MKYFAIYLLFINIVAAIICIIDKVKARLGNWRISEKTLFIASIIGGSLGMYISMRIVRHKTQHKRFMIGLPVIILAQCALLIWVLHAMS